MAGRGKRQWQKLEPQVEFYSRAEPEPEPVPASKGKNKNKAQKNSYWYFVDEYRRNHGLNSWESASTMASSIWQSLDADEKEKYKIKANQVKAIVRGSEEKYTSTGVPISSIIKHQGVVRESEERELTEINEMVEFGQRRNLGSMKFYIAHTNYYCCTQESLYVTCEIAISQFSLEKGVEHLYHQLVDAQIPLGYGLDAKDRAEECGIPTPPVRGSEGDYVKLLSEIIGFLQLAKSNNYYDGYRYPPIFVMPKDKKAVFNFIEQLCAEVGEDELQNFRVYSLPQLFLKIKNTLPSQIENFPYLSLAEEHLLIDRFTYTRGMSCELHEDGEKYIECSLSRVKRMAYIICDYCCAPFGITLIPGLHIPGNMEAIVPESSRASSSRIPNSYMKTESVASGSTVQTNVSERRMPESPTRWPTLGDSVSNNKPGGQDVEKEDDGFTSVKPRKGKGRGRSFK